MFSPKWEPPDVGSPGGLPQWESRHGAACHPSSTADPPRASPGRRIPVFSRRCRPSRSPRSPQPAVPGGPHPRAGDGAAQNQRPRPPAALRSFKQRVGGRRQPTGGERLLNMQMDGQEVRSTPGPATLPDARPPHGPWDRAGKG